MNLGTELLTSAAVFGFSVAVLGYFIRRWMERIESKVDALIESKGQLISREEYTNGMNRIHARMDEHITTEQELALRVAKLEGQAR